MNVLRPSILRQITCIKLRCLYQNVGKKQICFFRWHGNNGNRLSLINKPRRHDIVQSVGPLKNIHTSEVRRAAPLLGPILVKLSAPLSRIFFLLVGRRFRNWWKNLPPSKKDAILHSVTKNRQRLFLIGAGFVGISSLYYLYHLEDTPVTGRKRFIILSKNQLEDIADIQWRNLNDMLANKMLPVNSPEHTRVYKVAHRILNSNVSKEVNALHWEINVVNSKEVNAFVLANGQIYVFTGMLDAVENDNELAGILGHEMAHAILGHSAENLSRAGFFNIYSAAVLAALWAVIPTDFLAVFATWIQNTIEDILINLPYSRKLEKEADEVGLKLAARACFDVRHVPSFWLRMHSEDKNTIMQKNDWLSTHPSHENRIVWLTEWLPEALSIRKHFNCPELKQFAETVKTSVE